jgi:hypothetical protein
MDDIWDVMWKSALCGLIIGGAIGYFEKQKSERATKIGTQFTDLWNEVFTITPSPTKQAESDTPA